MGLIRLFVLLGAVIFWGNAAQASPSLPTASALSVMPALLVPAGFDCDLVGGKLVCGKTKGSKDDNDDHHGKSKEKSKDDDDDDHHGKSKEKSKDDGNDDDDHKGKNKKKKKEDSGLTECTIEQPGGGGGCKTGFKRVCEKLKSGKKCCGCVPDKSAPPPPAAEKIEDHPCFGFCSGTKCGGGLSPEARNTCVMECLATTNCSPH